VTWLTIIQKTKDKGFSRAASSCIYFLTPGLTTPTRNSKTLGKKWATILHPQKLSQMISIHMKKSLGWAPFSLPPMSCFSPLFSLKMTPELERMMGIARIRARGAT
jgi:hypothetical protein